MKLGFWKGWGKPFGLGVGSTGGGAGDTTAPTCVITTNATSPTETNPVTATITFSEVMTGFEVGDITISAGGSLASFATTDNIAFTVSWTLAAGANTMDVAEGVATDAAGNGNTAATQYAITNYAAKVNDAFTDTNNTDLTAHTIAPTNVPGNAWTNINTASSRKITVQSNRATPGSNNEGWYGLEVGTADVILSVVMVLPTATFPQTIYLRLDSLVDSVSTERNCWQVRLGNGVFQLYEHNASAPGTLRATTNLTTSAATDYLVRVVCVGNTITATVDGANQISYSGITTHLTSTKFGMKLISVTTNLAIADNFKVFF